MRFTNTFQISLLALVAAVPVSTSCGPTETTCADGVGCVPNEGGSSTSGVSGTGAKAGASAGGKGGKGSGGSSDTGGDAVVGGTSGVSGSGMSGAGGDAGSGGTSCDTTKSPGDEACLVSDEFAVFVSPNGMDDNDGSQRKPLATLTKAVEVAAGGKLVLVCDATYNEHVSITAGARIYGGFKCTDWSAEAAKPLFKPTSAGPALKVDGIADEVLVEHVSFEVGDATAAGGTALTALVNASPKVTLRAVSLKAGKGKAGANGSVTMFTFPDRTKLDGHNAETTTGGAPKPYTCPGGAETSGGIGGSASPSGQAGGDGTPLLEAGKGKGGTPGACVPNGGGSNGANAPDSPAASGAKMLGTLSALGWSTGSGGDGANGSPGQGGGGGASSKTAGGGGGGAGACGGAGAKGGQGGGASIALGVLASVVKVEASELVTADAGDGASSVGGQPGDKSEGGFGGLPAVSACQGGAGGLGGGGGAGGGGAGGISVGVVWRGAMAPTVSADTTATNGKAGAKGAGGVAGTNDGIAGVSQKILSLN